VLDVSSAPPAVKAPAADVVVAITFAPLPPPILLV